MEKVIRFLRDRGDIPVRTVEKSLGLPNATINLRLGRITDKHLKVIVGYLREHYGYKEDIVELIGNKDNPELEKVQIVKMYNVGVIPGFNDSILRYQNNQGLWRRLESLSYYEKELDKEGNKVLKKLWHPANDEVHSDKVGDYYISNNGHKVYISYKSKKKGKE